MHGTGNVPELLPAAAAAAAAAAVPFLPAIQLWKASKMIDSIFPGGLHEQASVSARSQTICVLLFGNGKNRTCSSGGSSGCGSMAVVACTQACID